MGGKVKLMQPEEYLKYVSVKHQRNINTLYLHYIDYKLALKINSPIGTIIDKVKCSYEMLDPGTKRAYSSMASQVKQLWVLNKSSDPYSLIDNSNGATTTFDGSAKDPFSEDLEERAIAFNKYLSSGEEAMNDIILFADVVALINEPVPNRSDWLPAEICMAKWSIQSGISDDLFHMFVCPGKVWLGFRAHFKEFEELHCIPEFKKDAVKDVCEIYSKIEKYVLRGSVKMSGSTAECASVIPVVCHCDSVAKVHYTLNTFIRERYIQQTQVANPSRVYSFEVFSMEQCLLALFQHSPRINAFTMDRLISICKRQQARTEFDNLMKQDCSYHYECEARLCAQTNCKKLIYLIISALCGKDQFFNVDLVAQSLPVYVCSSINEECMKSAQDDDGRSEFSTNDGNVREIFGESTLEEDSISSFGSYIAASSSVTRATSSASSARKVQPLSSNTCSDNSSYNFQPTYIPATSYRAPAPTQNMMTPLMSPKGLDDDTSSTISASTFHTNARSQFRGSIRANALKTSLPPGPRHSTAPSIDDHLSITDELENSPWIETGPMKHGRGRGRGHTHGKAMNPGQQFF